MNLVIISAPNSRTPYFARVGDHLRDAVIKSIENGTVTFASTSTDPNAPREIVRTVRAKLGTQN